MIYANKVRQMVNESVVFELPSELEIMKEFFENEISFLKATIDYQETLNSVNESYIEAIQEARVEDIKRMIKELFRKFKEWLKNTINKVTSYISNKVKNLNIDKSKIIDKVKKKSIENKLFKFEQISYLTVSSALSDISPAKDLQYTTKTFDQAINNLGAVIFGGEPDTTAFDELIEYVSNIDHTDRYNNAIAELDKKKEKEVKGKDLAEFAQETNNEMKKITEELKKINNECNDTIRRYERKTNSVKSDKEMKVYNLLLSYEKTILTNKINVINKAISINTKTLNDIKKIVNIEESANEK